MKNMGMVKGREVWYVTVAMGYQLYQPREEGEMGSTPLRSEEDGEDGHDIGLCITRGREEDTSMSRLGFLAICYTKHYADITQSGWKHRGEREERRRCRSGGVIVAPIFCQGTPAQTDRSTTQLT